MRKMKKLAALCLAMLMAFSLMAVTAAAHDAVGHEHDETCAEATVQPRKPAAWCHACGQAMTEIDAGRDDKGRYVTYQCKTLNCPNKTPLTFYW